MATSVVYQGDETAAKAYLPQAQNLLFRVKAFAKTAGVSIYSSTLNLNESAYCTALTTTSGDYIQIFCTTENTPAYTIPLPPELPDFLSGVVKGGGITTQQSQAALPAVQVLDSFKPNGFCYQRENAKAHAANQTDVPSGYSLNHRLAVPVSNKLSQFLGFDKQNTFGQAGVLRISQYTGRMQKLVQVLLGYGIPPGQQSGMQVLFDYSFARCHGLYRAADGHDWLIQIGINGVFAMPLYIYPGTKTLTTSRYRDLAAAAAEFNGLPTGRGFPTGKALTAAIASGDVLQLVQSSGMSDFYLCTSYSSVCGWAFNEQGDTARNTAYKWTGSVQTGYHYMVNIAIGAINTKRKSGDPIANGSAVITLVEQGTLYSGSVIKPPSFKMYEPMIGGLMSHPFHLIGLTPSTPPLCDTTMFVFYSQGQLSMVKFYSNPTTKNVNDATAETDPCMYVGSWKARTATGTAFIPPMFYTTEIDDRAVVVDSVTTTVTTGEDLGFGPMRVGDNLADITTSFALLPKYFKSTSVTNSTAGNYYTNMIAIPGGVREGYLYGFLHSVSSSVKSTSVSYQSLDSPYFYNGFRSVFVAPPINTCYLIDTRRVTSQGYSPDACNVAFANSGPWLQVCDDMPVGLKQPNYVPYEVRVVQPSTVKLTTFLFTGGALGRLGVPPPSQGVFENLWEAVSPDPTDGTIQQYNANYSSSLGEFHMIYDAGINATANSRKAVGSLLSDFDPNQSYNFIGVP